MWKRPTVCLSFWNITMFVWPSWYSRRKLISCLEITLRYSKKRLGKALIELTFFETTHLYKSNFKQWLNCHFSQGCASALLYVKEYPLNQSYIVKFNVGIFSCLHTRNSYYSFILREPVAPRRKFQNGRFTQQIILTVFIKWNWKLTFQGIKVAKVIWLLLMRNSFALSNTSVNYT